mgnify:CR=1 FL=1
MFWPAEPVKYSISFLPRPAGGETLRGVAWPGGVGGRKVVGSFGLLRAAPGPAGVPYRASPLDGRGAGYPIGNCPPPKSLLCSLTRKKRSKSGTQMGTVIAPLPEQCDTTAETSEWERAGHKRRGSRGLAPGPLSPISREKWGPRRAGGPPGALRPYATTEAQYPPGTCQRKEGFPMKAQQEGILGVLGAWVPRPPTPFTSGSLTAPS